ncbi:GNAT family N-acetyltransferase [Saccharopolyspora taberi]|uniref:N-acetyltransferase domain-containing protein n=1 Tax=Saccharopolyspora taberi TaxID=60895 RepID=A0ABN3VCT1_9PSEU
MAPNVRTTARLRLRPVSTGDLTAFTELESALRAREEPPRDPPDPARSARLLADFVRNWDQAGLGYWTVLFEDRIAGFGGVQPKRWRGRDCWNLFYKLDPGCWGRGLATEMAREAIAAAAAVRPDWPVLVETRPWNAPAIRLAERVGLTRIPPQDGEEWTALLLER